MKSLFSKLILLVAGVAAFLGISVANVAASAPASSVTEITGKSVLYLEHGKQINHGVVNENWHESHYSHYSHESHESHSSHYSGY